MYSLLEIREEPRKIVMNNYPSIAMRTVMKKRQEYYLFEREKNDCNIFSRREPDIWNSYGDYNEFLVEIMDTDKTLFETTMYALRSHHILDEVAVGRAR